MRIVADLDLCQGHAACQLEAPEVFDVPKHGKVHILVESPSTEQLSEVELAVRFCPTQALSLVDRNEGELR